MADNQTQSQSDNSVLPAKTTSSTIPSTPSDLTTNSVSDVHRPESSQQADETIQTEIKDEKLADESKQPSDPSVSEVDLTTSQEASSSARPSQSDLSEAPKENKRPVSSVLADEQKEASESAQTEKPEDPIPTTSAQVEEKPKEVETENKAQEEVSVQEQVLQETESPTVMADQSSKQSKPSENIVDKPSEVISEKVDSSAEALAKEDTDAKSPDNQVSQVQSGSSDNTSSINAIQDASSSASFRPEPPESPKEAPLANNSSQENGQKSFGDLISQDNQSQAPSIEFPKSTTFGDLLKDASNAISDIITDKKEEDKPKDLDKKTKPFSFGDLLKEKAEEDKTNIPDDLFEIKDTLQEIIIPQQTQPPPQQNQTSQSSPQNPQPQQIPPPASQSSNSPEPKVIEKIVEKPVEKIVEVIKEVPVEKIVEKIVERPIVDEEEVKRLYEQRIKERENEIRERGREVKVQKRDKRIEKIILYAQQKQSFDNQDIRDLLHISQSAVSVYLGELVNSGKLIKEGKSKYTKYHLP